MGSKVIRCKEPFKARESSTLPAPGARTNVPHTHEGREALSPLPGGSDTSLSFEISPFLQLLALLLGSWEDHGQVRSIHFKKDAVLRARDVGERGWILQFLVLIIRETFLRAKPQRTASPNSWDGYTRGCPSGTPCPKGSLSTPLKATAQFRTQKIKTSDLPVENKNALAPKVIFFCLTEAGASRGWVWTLLQPGLPACTGEQTPTPAPYPPPSLLRGYRSRSLR